MNKNRHIADRIKAAKARRRLKAEDYVKGILAGDRVMLGRAITLIESTRSEDRVKANEVVEKCLPKAGNSFRLGITGVPGVGKSTFIESLGLKLIDQGHKVAVLAVDPTSGVTGGSILGDKTRMEKLSTRDEAFIRPSPAGDSLGGVARHTREVITLCEAAGYDRILVETVGVGQSETAVHSMTDFFLLLLLPGGGDELQGIKRGIVEMADMIAINKSDLHLDAAKQAKRSYRNAVHLFPPKRSGWTVPTVLCSGIKGEGLDTILKHTAEYVSTTEESGYFRTHRQGQALHWFEETIEMGLSRLFREHPKVSQLLEDLKKDVQEGKRTPFSAADELLQAFS